MARTLLVVFLAALLSACRVGPRAETAGIAIHPRGANLTLRTPTQTIVGELLAEQDTALLVRTQADRVMLVPYGAISRGRIELAGRLTAGARPPARERERIRRVSRFPQGLTPALMRNLLATYEQLEPDVVQP